MSASEGTETVPVVINVMVEQWSPGTWPMLGPMGNPLSGGLPDGQAISWAEYGPREGIWRVLSLLGDLGVSASVYASGLLAETHPDVLAAVTAAGHELCGHGWSQDVLQPSLTSEEERRAVLRCRDALESASGVAPAGWISPRCTPTPQTAAVLAGAGYRWWGDVFDTDRAYLKRTSDGSIVALPFGMGINDLPLHIRYGHPFLSLRQAWQEELRGCRLAPGAHIDITVHAHIGGRPAGVAVLRDIICEALDAVDVELVTRQQLAVRVLAEAPGANCAPGAAEGRESKRYNR